MVEPAPLALRTIKTTEVLNVSEILYKGNSPEISLARVELNGVNAKVKNKDSGALYIVVEGEGQFTIFGEDDKVVKVKKGDSVFIPRDTWYRDQGKMTMYSICSPAFDPAKVKLGAE